MKRKKLFRLKKLLLIFFVIISVVWIIDNSLFGNLWVKLYANVSLKVFGIIPTDKVVDGKDGWYFYNRDYNLEIAEGKYPLTDEQYDLIVKKQEKLDKYFSSKGIEYVLILPQSKVSVYPEKLGSKYQVIKTPDDIIESRIKTSADIKVINLKPALINAKSENHQLYFKNDSHWNETGAYVAYKEIWNYLHNNELVESECAKVQWINSTYIGEFGKMMGDYHILKAEQTLESEIVNKQAYKIYNSEIYNKLESIRDKYGYNESIFVYQNDSPSADDKTVLLFGDSLFGHWNMTELLAENFKTFVYIWSYSMHEEVINIVNPDIVLYDVAERFTKNVLTEEIADFYFEVLKSPYAQIVEENVISLLKNNKECYIIVKNLGNEVWSEDKRVRLCLLFDGVDLGFRVRIPEGKVIKPGETYKFVIDEIPNYLQNTDKIECCMVQEGIQYFEEKYIVK